MSASEGERLIAFEAAIQELAQLQTVAARYRELRTPAESLFGELMDLGRSLRQAARRGVFSEDAVGESARQVGRLREEWLRRLAGVRSSAAYRDALAAYAADDQAGLAELLPAIFAGVRRADVLPPLFRAIPLAARRGGAANPFRSPEEVAAAIAEIRRDGLRPRPEGRDWWDTDLPALALAREPAAIDAPALLSIDRVPPSVALLSDGDTVLVFTARLPVECSVVLAESSDDAWYEASEGSYADYRDALARALRAAAVAVRIRPAWS